MSSWEGAERTADGTVIAYGFTQLPTATQGDLAGRHLFTWCGLDAVVFPLLIGEPAVVQTTCPTTGRAITLTVDPVQGITYSEPTAPVLSIVRPDGRGSLRCSFCDHIRWYADADAANLAGLPAGTELWSTDQATLEGPALIDVVLR